VNYYIFTMTTEESSVNQSTQGHAPIHDLRYHHQRMYLSRLEDESKLELIAKDEAFARSLEESDSMHPSRETTEDLGDQARTLNPEVRQAMRTGYIDRLILDGPERRQSLGPNTLRPWLPRNDDQANERLLPLFISDNDGSSPIMRDRDRAVIWQRRKARMLAFFAAHWKKIVISVLVILIFLNIVAD
jgi:hypothetical protein